MPNERERMMKPLSHKRSGVFLSLLLFGSVSSVHPLRSQTVRADDWTFTPKAQAPQATSRRAKSIQQLRPVAAHTRSKGVAL